MNKLLAAMLVLSLSGIAYADDYGKEAPKSGWKSEQMGKHRMRGEVTSVDHKSGMIKVKTDDGELTVHFPPKSIMELKTGDEIVLHLGYSMAGKGAMMKDEMKKDEMKKDEMMR